MLTNTRKLGRALIPVVATIALMGTTVSPAWADASNPIGITPRQGYDQSFAPGTPTMNWAIKDSFSNYIGGITRTLDGAKKLDSSHAIWPAAGKATLHATTVTANFRGTVNFMSMCEKGIHKRGLCRLDLTIFDPKVVYDTRTQQGTLYVNVHNYALVNGIAGPSVWVGPTMIPFAHLDGRFAKHSISNGVVTVSNIVTTLTKQGADTMIFYDEGQRIQDLTFSYAATSLDTGDADERVSIDQVNTGLDFTASTALLPARNGRAVLTYEDGGATFAALVDPKGGVGKGSKIDGQIKGPLFATTADGSALVWRGKDMCSLKTAPISALGVGAARTVVSLGGSCPSEGKILAFTVGATDDTVAYITATGRDLDSYTLTVARLNGSKVSSVELPSSAKLYGTDPASEKDQEPYGSRFGFISRRSLVALDDGTYLLVNDRTVNRADGSTTGGVPIHIDPRNSSAPATLVSAMSEQFAGGSHGLTKVVAGHGLIAIFSANSSGPTPVSDERARALRVGVYKYDGGTFNKVALKFLGKKWDSLAGGRVVDDSTLAFVSASDNPHLGLFTSSLREKGSPLPVRDMHNVEQQAESIIAGVDGATIIVGQYKSDSAAKIELNVVTDPKPSQPAASKPSGGDPVISPAPAAKPDAEDTSGSSPLVGVGLAAAAILAAVAFFLQTHGGIAALLPR